MPITLHVGAHPPATCRSYRHHVHAEVTRAPRRSDPREAGRSRHEHFQLTRDLDHLTPCLLRWCSEGTMLDGLVVEVTRPEDGACFRFALERVLVTSVLTSVEDDGPIETVTFDYGAVRWSHQGAPEDTEAAWEVFPADPEP
ncbi:MAG: type VI secretion system tube protein Hcp [Myxococcales bacterium]|nr:type VI secretion system tube protein Hcp [Myxococcales bacterium]MCB9664220.1 type VI secretion system tube protein Hcp [Alphaproteobacteria bacterium]